MSKIEGSKLYKTIAAISSAKSCWVGIGANEESYHLSIMVNMEGERKIWFEWTAEGLNIVDYDTRIIVGGKELGEFTIGQILQSSLICSRTDFDKTTNNCRKWINDIVEQLKQYSSFLSKYNVSIKILIIYSIIEFLVY